MWLNISQKFPHSSVVVFLSMKFSFLSVSFIFTSIFSSSSLRSFFILRGNFPSHLKIWNFCSLAMSRRFSDLIRMKTERNFLFTCCVAVASCARFVCENENCQLFTKYKVEIAHHYSMHILKSSTGECQCAKIIFHQTELHYILNCILWFSLKCKQRCKMNETRRRTYWNNR